MILERRRHKFDVESEVQTGHSPEYQLRAETVGTLYRVTEGRIT